MGAGESAVSTQAAPAGVSSQVALDPSAVPDPRHNPDPAQKTHTATTRKTARSANAAMSNGRADGTPQTPPRAKRQRADAASKRDGDCEREAPAQVTEMEAPKKRRCAAEPDREQPGKSAIALRDRARCGICEVLDARSMMRCRTCDVHVHAECYSDMGAEDAEMPTAALSDDAEWQCDICLHGGDHDQRSELHCAYCAQPATRVMRIAVLSCDGQDARFAHVACRTWHADALHPDSGSAQQDAHAEDATALPCEAPPIDLLAATQALLPKAPCCFCKASDGMRLQCHRAHCTRSFHAHCAAQSQQGFVEVQRKPFLLRQAYCDRHHHCRHDLTDLMTTMTTKPASAMLPRDAVLRLQRMKRKLDSYESVDEVLTEIVRELADQCRLSLKMSKCDPPEYNVKVLQVLQLVMVHLAQLRLVYDKATFSMSDAQLLDDAELAGILEKTFNPPRFVRKFAGLPDPNQPCQVCHEAFQERQHVLYCCGEDEQHAQHWKCTKRRSTRDMTDTSTAGKKRSKTRTVGAAHTNGKDTKGSRMFPCISDGIVCGVCRAAVDARAILAGRQSATRAEFDRRPSRFMFGGCFVNERSASTANANEKASLRPARSRSPSPSALKTSASTRKRALPSHLQRNYVSALQPIKMDRLNVQRTTRWLAHLAQAIRLMQQHSKGADSDVDAAVAASLQDAVDAVVRENDPSDGDQPVQVAGDDAPHVDNDTAGVDQQDRLPKGVRSHLEEAKNLVGRDDPYALHKIELAEYMLTERCGPGLSELNVLVQEYTRFVYVKHTRAVEKARNEKRRRRELEAEEAREQERKRLDRQAELALKKQMLAMRKRQRQQLREQ